MKVVARVTITVSLPSLLESYSGAYVEAMSFGVPIVTSDRDFAREVCDGRLVAVYQPHVVERTRRLHRELAEALGLADVAVVTDIVGARDAPRPGVSGKLVLDGLPPHVRGLWAPTLDDAARLALHVLRSGDVVVTFGVGEPWKVARAIAEGLPA